MTLIFCCYRRAWSNVFQLRQSAGNPSVFFRIKHFCGGGYQSLLLSTQSKDVTAVVAFYAPSIFSEQFQVEADPKPNLMDVVKQMKVPIQGHYGAADPIIL